MFERHRLLPASFLAAGLALMAIGSCAARPGPAAGDAKSHVAADYDARPPFTVLELWGRILEALNERNGSVTKERFEQIFNVHFAQVRRDKDTTVYLIREHRDWYLSASATITNEAHEPAGPGEFPPHRQWALGWHADTFGDPSRHECLTAAHVHADLLAHGWTSPWSASGDHGSGTHGPAPAHDEAVPDIEGRIIEPGIPPALVFGRQTDPAAGRWRNLPYGRLFATGILLDSCITGITVIAPL